VVNSSRTSPHSEFARANLFPRPITFFFIMSFVPKRDYSPVPLSTFPRFLCFLGPFPSEDLSARSRSSCQDTSGHVLLLSPLCLHFIILSTVSFPPRKSPMRISHSTTLLPMFALCGYPRCLNSGLIFPLMAYSRIFTPPSAPFSCRNVLFRYLLFCCSPPPGKPQFAKYRLQFCNVDLCLSPVLFPLIILSSHRWSLEAGNHTVPSYGFFSGGPFFIASPSIGLYVWSFASEGM